MGVGLLPAVAMLLAMAALSKPDASKPDNPAL
jgi:hypothetical protein